MSAIESSRFSEENSALPSENQDSYAPTSSATDVTEETVTESSEIGDSSMVNSSITGINYNNEEKVQKTRSTNPDGPRFYQRKRFWAMCLAITVVLAAIFIPLLFLVIIPAAAQSSINNSKLDIQVINITKATNNSFYSNMLSKVSGSGPFSAKIEFNGAVKIIYNGNEIGTAELENFSTSKGQGTIQGLNKEFIIEDEQGFTDFATASMKDESFKWAIRGSANVRASGININNLKLNKEIVLPGSNGFKTVSPSLISLNVTQNPDSLEIDAVTSLYNPSPVGIELGDMYLQLTYNGTVLSDAVAKGVTIATKNNILNIKGSAPIPTSDVDKNNFMQVMSSYLTGTPVLTSAKIKYIISPSGDMVDWINKAAKSFDLGTVIGQTRPPALISNADFGEMNIKFTPDAPYSPTISSKNAIVDVSLPFHVDFQILAAGQNLTFYAEGKPIATINTPMTNVTATATGISLNIPETPMRIIDKDTFSDFFANLTANTGSSVDIAGTTNTVVKSILGENTVNGIPFNITTSLQGFNQFNSNGSPPTVKNITVLQGTTTQLTIGLIVTLTNPTKYSISAGKVTLDMFYKDNRIGSAVIQDLSLVPGPNDLVVVATLDDPENGPGRDILISFLTGQPATINIKGSDNSTDIASLAKAFKTIDISTTIPVLGLQLVQSSKLVVDNQTAATTGVVEIANTFVAPLSIYTTNSSFIFNGTVLGTVEQDMTTNPIFIPGNSVKQIPLPVNMTNDPVATFSMIRSLAIQNNLDVSVFDSLIVFGKINVPGVDPNVKPTPEAAKSFDLGTFVTKALAKIPITVNMNSRVAIGDYFMTIDYKQDIISESDASILNMIPKFAQPMLQPMLEQAQMNIDSVFIKNIDVAAFDVALVAQIASTGPIPGQISFPKGIDLSLDNILLGNLGGFPTITADPVDGAKIDTSNSPSRFQIADIPTFTAFIENMMSLSGSVTGETTADVVITTSGITIGPITIKKPIELIGFNNINSFQLLKANLPVPGEPNPVLSAEVALNNPTISGIELGTVVFNLFGGSDLISTVTSNNVAIVPKGTSTVDFQGPVSLPPDRVGPVFTGLISKTIQIIVQGVSVKPPKASGDVVWLSTSIKSFVLKVPFDLTSIGKAPPAPAAPAAP